jgi:hypothetical protein
VAPDFIANASQPLFESPRRRDLVQRLKSIGESRGAEASSPNAETARREAAKKLFPNDSSAYAGRLRLLQTGKSNLGRNQIEHQSPNLLAL